MSTPTPPQPAKLVIGCLLRKKPVLETVIRDLITRFGPVDAISSWLAFDYTSYYESEMGQPLVRRLMAFKRLIDQRQLPDIKLATNALEADHIEDSRRRINLDPGYLLPERFVLATGKNYTHRIYLGKGIYADLTLIFTRGAFQSLPWTYPDYAQSDLQEFLLQVRRKYLLDLRGATETSRPAE